MKPCPLVRNLDQMGAHNISLNCQSTQPGAPAALLFIQPVARQVISEPSIKPSEELFFLKKSDCLNALHHMAAVSLI